jgi:hypothetical protein
MTRDGTTDHGESPTPEIGGLERWLISIGEARIEGRLQSWNHAPKQIRHGMLWLGNGPASRAAVDYVGIAFCYV